VPVVVGSESQVLDLGRSVRLAGPGQVQRLWLRDRGCSFPGCTVPPTWCDAHHVSWWSRGGPTDLRNLALLCGRHHTVVHERDLAATVTDAGVTWHV
jgi:HNH endonuclease